MVSHLSEIVVTTFDQPLEKTFSGLPKWSLVAFGFLSGRILGYQSPMPYDPTGAYPHCHCAPWKVAEAATVLNPPPPLPKSTLEDPDLSRSSELLGSPKPLIRSNLQSSVGVFQGSVNGGFQTVVRVLWGNEITLPLFASI